MSEQYQGDRILPETEGIIINDEQAKILWDNARSKEPVGEARNYVLDNGSGVRMTISSQVYDLVFENPKKGEPTVTLKVKVTCQGTCKSSAIGGSCTNRGCSPKGLDCTTHNCGSWCIATCVKTSTGFGSIATLEMMLALF